MHIASSTLIWQTNSKNLQEQTTRWVQRLQEYNSISPSIQDRKYNMADALSWREKV
jgi:hypothetical protein